ncbi:MAG: hypothetical protein PHQ23_06870 [Candidatus Wallbacteria bacterium]|nr:hypothetical protein [Candidatus Wallbacteria bacterium]
MKKVLILIFCSAVLYLWADTVDDLLGQFGSGTKPEKARQPSSSDEKKSQDKGFGLYFGDNGDTHWFFSFGNQSGYPGHNHDPHGPVSHDLYHIMKKYDIENGKVVPLVCQGSRIGNAIVTGDRSGLRDAYAVVLKYDSGNIVINMAVDRNGKFLKTVQVFAMQKRSIDSFPFYRKDEESGKH